MGKGRDRKERKGGDKLNESKYKQSPENKQSQRKRLCVRRENINRKGKRESKGRKEGNET